MTSGCSGSGESGSGKARGAIRTTTTTVTANSAVSVGPAQLGHSGRGASLRSGGPLATRSIVYVRFQIPPPVGPIVAASLRVVVETKSKAGFLAAGTVVRSSTGALLATTVRGLTYALGGSGSTTKGQVVTVALRGLTAGAGGQATIALQSESNAVVRFDGVSGAEPPTLTVTRAIGAPSATPPTSSSAASTVHVVAAGDIACDPSRVPSDGPGTVPGLACGQQQTSDLALRLHPDAVLPLGDTQYTNGATAKYNASYGPSWGRLLGNAHPAPGNHEYISTSESIGGAGYYAYFGAAAGPIYKGWYSFNLGKWHLIALNGECAEVGGCQSGSAQERWLAADLAHHPNQCTLAYWHEPRFSSGQHGDGIAYSAFWTDLYRAGADLVLNGHDHDYERFAPQNPLGQADPARGITEFVVGTGGENQRPFKTVQANSVVRGNHSFGVLDLTLNAHSYSWRFAAVPGSTFTDTGSGKCHLSSG